MFLVLTLTCIGLGLVRAEHAPAKMKSFTSSHLPEHYTFTYEMDDGTVHKEEGRLVDGVWEVISQFSCTGDDSPSQTFSYVGNKCGFNRRAPTPLGLTDKMGDALMESVESQGHPFQSRNAVPFSNETDAPLRIGLPISTNEVNFFKPVNNTANVSTNSSKTDTKSQPAEDDSTKEGNITTDGQSQNQTYPELSILEVSDKHNLINKSDIYTNEVSSPESSTLSKTKDSEPLKPVPLNQSTDGRPLPATQEETNEIPTQDTKTTNPTEIASTKVVSEKPQLSINSSIDGEGNLKHPIIKRVQITRHPENGDVGVNVSMVVRTVNISEMMLGLDQPISDDQQIDNNKSSNFQVFFKKAGNTTDEKSDLFISSDDVKKDIFYNNSRSFLEDRQRTVYHKHGSDRNANTPERVRHSTS